MKKQEISYEVKGNGLGNRKKDLKIFVLFFYIIISSYFFLFITNTDYERNIFFLLRNLIFILVFLFILYIFIYGKRIFYGSKKYYIDNSGIEINDGRDNKKYFWDNFSYFYIYSHSSIWNSHVNRKIDDFYRPSGKIFCLRLKNGGYGIFLKRVVVIYSELENAEEVENFITNNLEKRKMSFADTAFISLYEFK